MLWTQWYSEEMLVCRMKIEARRRAGSLFSIEEAKEEEDVLAAHLPRFVSFLHLCSVWIESETVDSQELVAYLGLDSVKMSLSLLASLQELEEKGSPNFLLIDGILNRFKPVVPRN